MILSGSPFDCDCLVALLSVTLPGSRLVSVLLYVGIINILCMYHIKYYVMFSYMHCVCDMLFHICGVMLCCIYNVRLHM